MPFDPQDFLRLARATVPVPAQATEAQIRMGIGRLYYGLYLIGRTRLLTRSNIDRRRLRRGSHQYFVEVHKRQSFALGSQFDDLRIPRVEADYHLTPSDPSRADWKANWRKANQLAHRLLSRLAAL